MNIVTVLNTLKEKKLILDTEEGVSLFSDCFNKFGISILLLKEEEKFNRIVDLLVENAIPIQKANGMYSLRVFAVDYHELKDIINEYFSIGELDFLRKYPEIIAEAKTVHFIANNMKRYQELQVSYKNEEGYDIDKILSDELEEEIEQQEENVRTYLQSCLDDASLINHVENGEMASEEQNFDATLELQKAENKICEKFLVSNGDTWDIIINDKKVNTYEQVKDTIKIMTELNLTVDYHDALVMALFYNTQLSTTEIKELMEILKEGGML